MYTRELEKYLDKVEPCLFFIKAFIATIPIYSKIKVLIQRSIGMKLSKFYMPTLKEDPQDAEIASHKLLIRGAMIRRSSTGVYSYLPLGYRVVRKIENIVREEMDRFGAQEIIMSIMQPKEIWEESGRWAVFGPEMFKFKDRNGKEYCLGPTAEEYFTSLVKHELSSYKQLPLNLYQIQTKFRDEKRPRFGINRARDFIMKDAYTFDKDMEGLEEAYMNMYRAYEAIFDRLHLEYKVVRGDSGAMGGNTSHEFIAIAETGEGVIVYCDKTGYAATDEKAEVIYKLPPAEELGELKKVETPDAKTIEDLAKFLDVPLNKCMKAVLLRAEDKDITVFIPGDRELNMTKLCSYLGIPEHEIEMQNEEDIASIGGVAGFTGPVGLKGRVIIDKRLTQIQNLVAGANEKDYHLMNLNYKRDFDGEIAEDLLMVKEGDVAPGTDVPLKFARGIEVGNIFQLGTKYSKSMNATFLDENGKEQYFYMGSYGVGVTRSVAAVVEQYHDDDGIIWPMNVAPYQVIITCVNPTKEEQYNLGEKLYNEFLKKKVEVIFDDRDERVGVKFKDRDLIGIPIRITVGKKAGENIVEYSRRHIKENTDLTAEEAVERALKEIEEELN